MSKSLFDHCPESVEKYSSYQYMINYNIEQVSRVIDEETTITEWQSDSVIVPNLNYGTIVDTMVREKYNLSEELAILRQRDTKPEHFQEYNDYVEECKYIASTILDNLNK